MSMRILVLLIIVAHYFSRTADFLGRRRAMSAECLVFSLGVRSTLAVPSNPCTHAFEKVIVQLTTFTKWYQFAIGRLIAGFGVGALSVRMTFILIPLHFTYHMLPCIACAYLIIGCGADVPGRGMFSDLATVSSRLGFSPHRLRRRKSEELSPQHTNFSSPCTHLSFSHCLLNSGSL